MILNYKFNKNRLFFTSDTHFYHKNMIYFANRPYENVEHMNEMLITNWNSVVKSGDDVIIAGDFIWSKNLNDLENILSQLNGNKFLILGNHDYHFDLHKTRAVSLFNGNVYDALEFIVEDDELETNPSFYITHYPCEFWKPRAIHLHGHVHSGPKSTANEVPTFKSLRYDIGVDNNNYTPISYQEIIRIITKQSM